MNIVLLSTYDLGHQPFGLASPASWLRARGHSVTLVDLAVEALPAEAVRRADAVGFFLPMHTAARLAAGVIGKVRTLNPAARLIAYGLYAAPNAEYLRSLGVESVISGEFEAAVCKAVERSVQTVSLERLAFLAPERGGLPSLDQYAKLHVLDSTRVVGYTEASRGCKHLCRHCPVVPVYQGAFRVVQAEVVLEDIERQVAAGAQHITFGDPDFFNGPAHAMRIVEALHTAHADVTFDVTIKVEHLLRHRQLLPRLRQTGCLFVTSAVESVDDQVLVKLAKGHTRADFVEAVALVRATGLTLAPTFVAFTPWITREGYCDLLRTIRELDLMEQVAPVQLALRLLIPPQSRLLELEEIRAVVTHFDQPALLHRWQHPDPDVDVLAANVLRLVTGLQKRGLSRRAIFRRIWEEAHGAPPAENFDLLPRTEVPYLDEPWYC
ncbi:MAG: radical SAM protein [Acidobacteria bacterium]|nr:radical SAM protein [Acidobacteriota bacterium]